MSTPFLGSMMAVAFNFAPKGWAQCAGQLLPINQNQALFALLGTTFGGNGQTTFALPDLRGRAAMSSGQGPGLSNYSLGQIAGSESITLNISQMPLHAHAWMATSTTGSVILPPGNLLGNAANFVASPPDAAAGNLNPGTITNIGGSQPHTNQSPFLVINWIIALTGIFPSQN
jgi:microcystin-dependent protein